MHNASQSGSEMTGAVAFDQMVFSGGGIRCFWHGGFMSVVGAYEDLRPARVSGVSGGALSAAAWIGGRERELKMLMEEAFRLTASNFDRQRSNCTPHEEVYRAVVATTLDAAAIDRIAEGPSYQVTLSVPPRHLPPGLAAAYFGVLYKVDQALRGTPHLRWTSAAGLNSVTVDARAAAREGRLVDLVCAAATIPPVFDVPRWDGQQVMDGGMFDKAPFPEPDEGRTLILMTSRYANLPENDERGTYVQPSRAVAADKIDFSAPEKVDNTWQQGVSDARNWLADMKS